MIAKITRGKSPQAIGRYLHGPGKANEHAYDTEAHGRVIGGSLGNDGDASYERWARKMQRLNDKRADIERPIHQISLRAAPGDVLMSDAKWETLAREYMRDIGLEHNPWVVVRHAPDHVHIVANRINGDGSVWSNSHDRYKSQKATRALEERHGLQRVPSRTNGRPAPTQTPELTHPAERALTERQAPSWRAQIKRGIDKAMYDSANRAEFAKSLADQGISVYQSPHTTDLVYTIETKNGQRKISGHKLGADYQEGPLSHELERRATLTHHSELSQRKRGATSRTSRNADDLGRDTPSNRKLTEASSQVRGAVETTGERDQRKAAELAARKQRTPKVNREPISRHILEASERSAGLGHSR